MTTPAVQRAVEILRAGGLVAIPTETVYGLAADAGNPLAVAAVYAAKGRPSFNPLIAHVADLEAGRRIAVFDARAEALAREAMTSTSEAEAHARRFTREAAASAKHDPASTFDFDRMVADAGTTMHDIVEQVQKVAGGAAALTYSGDVWTMAGRMTRAATSRVSIPMNPAPRIR